MIKLHAQEAVAGGDGMTTSSLVNTYKKREAYIIMLQQFRQAIGLAIVWGNVEYKMARLNYVREIVEKAKATYNNGHHSNNKWKPNGRSNLC